jgi:hypothetical protein
MRTAPFQCFALHDPVYFSEDQRQVTPREDNDAILKFAVARYKSEVPARCDTQFSPSNSSYRALKEFSVSRFVEMVVPPPRIVIPPRLIVKGVVGLQKVIPTDCFSIRPDISNKRSLVRLSDGFAISMSGKSSQDLYFHRCFPLSIVVSRDILGCAAYPTHFVEEGAQCLKY